MRLGAHQSITGGIYKSIERALHDKCEALQVFVKNASRWEAKPLTEKDINSFKAEHSRIGIKNICAHSSYLINLAAPNEETLVKSINAASDELNRCDLLEIPYYVLHPGAHLDTGLEQGIKRIADSLGKIYAENGFNCMTLLEVTAGQGTSIGHSFEHIKAIIDQSSCSEKLGVCLDSCHMFMAGYDLVNEYDKVFDDLFEIFGDKIKVFHLNDCKKPLGSRIDRHELVGKGTIGEEFFRKVVNDKRFKDTLGILETPIDEGTTYKDEVIRLKSFRENNS
jgi:deoxyribonuclease-4